jgi:hypothetical protein
MGIVLKTLHHKGNSYDELLDKDLDYDVYFAQPKQRKKTTRFGCGPGSAGSP